jgi:PEP-CTERM motif-containing protein
MAVAPALRATASFANGANVSPGAGSISATSSSGGNFTVTAYAFSLANSNAATTFSATWLANYNTRGLGVCNAAEQSACSQPDHSIDNGTNTTPAPYDFVLLQFSVPLSTIILTLDPFGSSHDMDITYWTGTCTTGVGTCSPAGKTIGTAANALSSIGNLSGSGLTVNSGQGIANLSAASSAQKIVTLNLNGQSSVNWVLIGAATANWNDSSIDYFKLNAVGAPEPATFGLMGGALAALAFFRRKKLFGNTFGNNS